MAFDILIYRCSTEKEVAMCVMLKDISKMDKYIYCTALLLEQPFTTAELLEAVHVDHIGWKIELIRTRCKKYRKQKMLRKMERRLNVKMKRIKKRC